MCFFLLLHLLIEVSFISSYRKLDYIKNESYFDIYTISILFGMNNRWTAYIDTYNDYLILYESKLKDDKFHQLIIDKLPNIINDQKTILNYEKTIEVQESYFSMSLVGVEEFENYKLYYTKESTKDKDVLKSLPLYLNRISVGMGLDITKEEFSLVYSLYNKGFISKKCFSFQNSIGSINIGPIPRGILSEYLNNFITITIPKNKKKWGFHFNSITIGGKETFINKYAYINSAMDSPIRSKIIYKLFKQYFNENYSFKNRCNENENKRIVCSIEYDLLNQNITLNIGNGIIFNITLNPFFKGLNHDTFEFKIPSDNCLEINDEDPIHIGKSFLQIFNAIEFDYELRQISFYSNKILFKVYLNNKTKIQILIGCFLLLICLSIFLVSLKIKFFQI